MDNGYQWMQTQNPLDVLKTLSSVSVKDSVCRLDFPPDFQSLLSSEYSTLESVTEGISHWRKVNKLLILHGEENKLTSFRLRQGNMF